MKNHTFTAMTCARARRLGVPTTRTYGHTVIIQPPLQWIDSGSDVEGIGYVPKWGGPQLQPLKSIGWYRFKEDAQTTAENQNRASSYGCSCKLCDPANVIHQPRNLDLVA
jgi:hypothetical protein